MFLVASESKLKVVVAGVHVGSVILCGSSEQSLPQMPIVQRPLRAVYDCVKVNFTESASSSVAQSILLRILFSS